MNWYCVLRIAYSVGVLVSLGAPGTLHAQRSERVGRLELSNGYVSVDARPDGLMVISAVGTLRFGVASGVFSPRTTRAWLAEVTAVVDSIRRIEGANIGSSPFLMGADGVTEFSVSFELSDAPSIATVLFRRADGVEVGIAGVARDSSFARLLAILQQGVDRTVTLTRASPDSVRLTFSDQELTGRTAARDSIAEHPPSGWSVADRVFVTATASALFGVGVSYANHMAITCISAVGYCRWKIDNPGFAVGSVIGASLAGFAFTKDGTCSVSTRLARILAASTIAAVPGAVLASSGKQVSLAVTPVLQSVALEMALKDCRR